MGSTATRITVTKGDVDMTIALEVHDCPTCGVIYALPESYAKNRRQDGASWQCPNGHGVSYHGDYDKLKEQLRQAEADTKWYKDAERRAADARDAAQNSLKTTKGHVTRLRKRAVAGSCPFGCGRHFTNLERHVATKHAGQALEAEG